MARHIIKRIKTNRDKAWIHTDDTAFRAAITKSPEAWEIIQEKAEEGAQRIRNFTTENGARPFRETEVVKVEHRRRLVARVSQKKERGKKGGKYAALEKKYGVFAEQVTRQGGKLKSRNGGSS